MKLVNFRVPEDELERYKLAADRHGGTLSEWIRFRCAGAYLAADELPDASPLLTGTPTPKRKEMCVHRRRPDQFCNRCD